MNANRTRLVALVAAALGTSALIVDPVVARASEDRDIACVPTANIASALNDHVVPPLALLRIACPVLGGIVEEYAMQDLGEGLVDEESTPSAREIAAAALGEHIPLLRYQVKNARAAGATMRDFRGALYLITVKAGVPKGIEVTRVLMELFDDANKNESR